MGANVVLETLAGSGDWQRAVNSSLLCDVTIRMPAANSSTPAKVRFRGGAGKDWPKGTQISFKGVDLYDFEFLAQLGDDVVIAAQTR